MAAHAIRNNCQPPDAPEIFVAGGLDVAK